MQGSRRARRGTHDLCMAASRSLARSFLTRNGDGASSNTITSCVVPRRMPPQKTRGNETRVFSGAASPNNKHATVL